MKLRTGHIAGLASLIMVAGIAGAEEAATPSSAPTAADTRAAKETPRKKAVAEAAQCTQVPGSHIRLAKPEDCAKAARGPYRSFSQEELERTGETDIAEALRKLDPRLR